MALKSTKQKGTGSPLERTKSRSPVIDAPSKPVISVAPAFRLVVPAEAPWRRADADKLSPAPRARARDDFLRSRSGVGGAAGSAAAMLATAAAHAAATGRGVRGVAALAATGGGAFGGGGGGGARAAAARPAPRLGVWGPGPPAAQPRRVRHNPANSELRAAFERGDLPCSVVHGTKPRLRWTAPPAALDVAHYLPLFAAGLREVEYPFSFFAEAGFADLLAATPADKLAPVVPALVLPLRAAINTRLPEVMARALAALAAVAAVGAPAAGARAPAGTPVGRALLPFYRQLLPVCNLYANANKNLGDGIDYGQRFAVADIGATVAATLRALDATGGPDAYVNILYSVPTYSREIGV